MHYSLFTSGASTKLFLLWDRFHFLLYEYLRRYDLCCHLLVAVSGGSHRLAGAASKCFERKRNRVRADHLWVQQSRHQPLRFVTVATVDKATQCGPSSGESTGGHCEGVEELHWEGKRINICWWCCVGVVLCGCLLCIQKCTLCVWWVCFNNEYLQCTPTTLYSHDTFSLHSSVEKLLLLLQIWVKYRNSWIPVGVLWCNSRLQASCFFLPKHCVMKRFPSFRPISSVNAVSSQELPQSTAPKKENRSNCKKWWSLPHMWNIPCCPLVFYGPFVLQDMMSFSAHICL